MESDAWVRTRPFLVSGLQGVRYGLWKTGPFALVMLLVVGATVAVGVNLSTAYPSEQKPFGWPGAATFSNGVAMVRKELVLATVLPALGAALVGLRRLEPRRDALPFVGGVAAAGYASLGVGVMLAAGWGAWAASKSTWSAYWAFVAAHVLLAWAIYSLVFFLAVVARPYATSVSLAVVGFYVAVYDNLLQWRVFREAGFFRLQAGDFPPWFLAGQAGSPIAAYRGFLILDFPAFRDGLENAVLKGATLPPWASAATFAAVLWSLWILLPMGLAASVWKVRATWTIRPWWRRTAVPATSPGNDVAGGPL